MSDKKIECLGCIGLEDTHTCEGWAEFQEMKANKDNKDELTRLQSLVEKQAAEIEALGSLIKSADPDYEETQTYVLALCAENVQLQARIEVLTEAATAAKDCYWIGGPEDALKEFMAELDIVLAEQQP